MKKLNLEKLFLNEILMRNIAIISAVCGIVSIILLSFNNEIELLVLFEKLVKVLITIITIWSFSKFHWDVTKGMLGALLFTLMYQESYLVLGKLWGETSDFDTFLIMGVQGSLYLAAESMSLLMTIIIIVNHFIIGYSHFGNYANVIFNQLSIIFKIFLYVCLLVINVFLNQPNILQLNYGFEYLSDLCIVILVICVETQLDNFKTIKHELTADKKRKAK